MDQIPSLSTYIEKGHLLYKGLIQPFWKVRSGAIPNQTTIQCTTAPSHEKPPGFWENIDLKVPRPGKKEMPFDLDA